MDDFTYTLKRSARARHMRITVFPTGTIEVTAPVSAAPESVARFAYSKREWALRTRARFLKRLAKRPPEVTDEILAHLRIRSAKHFKLHAEPLRRLIINRLEVLNRHYQFKHGRVSIKNQRSRWGSCSRTGNLNFSYKLAFLPEDLRDYVIVHELCHLKEFNHSKRFWDAVAVTFPNHRELRRRLRHYS